MEIARRAAERRETAPRRASGRLRRRGALVALVAIAAAALPHAAFAGSLRCKGKLVQVGDPKARLVAACGEPISRDVVAVVRAYEDGEKIQSSYAEEWAYPTAGVEGHRILRFVGGRLVGEGMRCSGRLVRPGDTTVSVLQRCGEPVTRDSAGLAHPPPGSASRAVVSDSPIEQWVYSQGEGSFLRIVRLRGGTIESIETGPRR